MNQIKNMNLPIVGKVQHGEQRLTGNTKRVVELGYFIAKVQNDNMQYLINRFNEKYPNLDKIPIQFFDEEPLSVRRIRYNKGGAACYCMAGKTEGKQKISNKWTPINCSEECEYRKIQENATKPICNEEGTLKFLLPEISLDRIWIMKITGRTSIERLRNYIFLQKQLGNSLIGNYYLFLNKEAQTTKLGKTFNNYILDIIKNDGFNSDTKTIPNNQLITDNVSTSIPQKVENSIKISENQTPKNQILGTQDNSQETTFQKKPKANKKSKKETDEKLEDKESQKQVNIPDSIDASDIKDLGTCYTLIDTSIKEFMKKGIPTKYLVGNFIDKNDKQVEVVIPSEFSDLANCDLGTVVVLDLESKGNKTFTTNIKYVEKRLKKVVA